MAEDWKDQISGGRADLETPVEFDPKQLAIGLRHEMEHTDDPKLAMEIAMDHLEEDPLYYQKLKSVEERKMSFPKLTEVFKKVLKEAEGSAFSPSAPAQPPPGPPQKAATLSGHQPAPGSFEESLVDFLTDKHGFKPSTNALKALVDLVKKDIADSPDLSDQEKKMTVSDMKL